MVKVYDLHSKNPGSNFSRNTECFHGLLRRFRKIAKSDG